MRNISQAVIDKLKERHITVGLAFEVELEAETFRLWTGRGDITINNETFIGSGDFLKIDQIEENSELSAASTNIQFSIVDPIIRSAFLSDIRPNKRAKIYFLILDSNSVNTLLFDPILILEGLTDLSTLDRSSGIANLKIENKLLEIQKASPRRFTKSDQQLYVDANDTGFNLVDGSKNINIEWG